MRWWIWPRWRFESYGSPFRNQESGTPEDDVENNDRFNRAMDHYLKEYRLKNNIPEPNLYDTKASLIMPVPLAIFGWSLLRIYTRPSSVYLRFFAVIGLLNLGWFLGVKHERREFHKFQLRHFKNFDKNVQDALQSGDARYLRHIWRKLDGLPTQTKPAAVENK